ncbi:MAG TPA: asparagine synthase (glutamine-hydrolyzing) [Longimicrobiaceae bacterium]|nr:asparagine synthase (glutamine-hydrolyzing) [Longimicrobiaceae bacterium]
MCGICGTWSPARRGREAMATIVQEMADAITHRGPDSDGVWLDEECGVGLGHRRLAILDLSPHGHQPMLSPSGRYVIAFNGEIYNFRELRRELKGRFHFEGTSDTEVMLAAIEAYGLEAAVHRFIGMFAFALWDRREQRLHLVRDRLGIKPLYYGYLGGSLVFASELHAIRAHPEFTGEIDRESISLLLRYNCIPAPHSIYRGIRKLPPGSILTLDFPEAHRAAPRVYWSAEQMAESGLQQRFAGSDEDAVQALDALLRDAVGVRMVADVPLGAFLSGGVDSSLVVALMQAQSDQRVRTYSIGSPDRGYDEAGYAGEVARHLGTDHTGLYVTAEDALAVIPHLASIYDEPFSDSSQIPTFLVSRLARRDVAVSLSGDGGDELFGGYNRHVWGKRVWNVIRHVPASLRESVGRYVESTPPAAWDRGYTAVERLLPRRFRQQMFGYKVHKLANLVSSRSPADLYNRTASHWQQPSAVVMGVPGEPKPLSFGGVGDSWDFTEQMMYRDLITYLPDDILTKLDRASMAVSLEARVPLLDHRVVEFAWRVPLHMKIRGGQSKWLLRQVLYRYVPRALIDRPKAGFGIPLGEWLRGPLREWAESLLAERRLKDEGFFHPRLIRERWAQHLSGRSSWQYHLWDVLMFQAWLESTGEMAGTPASGSGRSGT